VVAIVFICGLLDVLINEYLYIFIYGNIDIGKGDIDPALISNQNHATMYAVH